MLRSHSGVKILQRAYERLCKGNTYTNTLHVLTAAIIKLGKTLPVQMVYRAPGGALPASFWHKQQPEGVQGGLELAFMSTTTAKAEAMAYARRAPGMILFEIEQVTSIKRINSAVFARLTTPTNIISSTVWCDVPILP